MADRGPTMPLTLVWDPPPSPGRTLFLVFAYHGRDRDRSAAGWYDRLAGPGAHGHRIVHRDHYANARPLAYQLAEVRAMIDLLPPGEPPAIVFDTALGEPVPDAGERVELANPRLWRHTLPARAREFENVIVVYADALGLGCEEAERRLVRECGSILAINGRRRVFRIDAAMSSRMDRHRWLADTRLVERTLAVAVRPFAAALAAWDRMSRRTA